MIGSASEFSSPLDGIWRLYVVMAAVVWARVSSTTDRDQRSFLPSGYSFNLVCVVREPCLRIIYDECFARACEWEGKHRIVYVCCKRTCGLCRQRTQLADSPNLGTNFRRGASMCNTPSYLPLCPRIQFIVDEVRVRMNGPARSVSLMSLYLIFQLFSQRRRTLILCMTLV